MSELASVTSRAELLADLQQLRALHCDGHLLLVKPDAQYWSST